jgi:DNA invertase Pin-like site-specific DNA recombinase
VDFTKLAHNLLIELKERGISKATIARRLGVSRQALYRRIAENRLTTEDLTIIAAMSVTMVGGNVLIDFLEMKGGTDES